MTWRVEHADCIEAMRELDEASIDAVVCDPPYGLEFMGKDWDRLGTVSGGAGFGKPGIGDRPTAWTSYTGSPNPSCLNCGGTQRGREGQGVKRCRCDSPEFPNHRLSQQRAMQEWHHAWATEALRVLKPGGFLVAAGGTRTFHRLVCAIEDAGFEIRDCIAHMYGSGFPKSLNVSEALRKLPACSCDVANEVGAIDPIAPASAVGTRAGAEPGAVPLTGGTADAAVGVGPDVGSGAADALADVEDGVENIAGDDPPVVLGSGGVAGAAESDEVGGGVGGLEVPPEPLRDQVVGDEFAGGPAIGASPVAGDDLGGDRSPATSSVLPLAAPPSGVSGAAESIAVGRGHAGPRTVDGDTLPVADGLDSADGAGELHRLKCKACGGVRRELIPEGMGTALKPAFEPWTVARKPLTGTVAANVLEFGTGALNIDGTRVGENGTGRWPSNCTLSHLPECEEDACAESCPVAELDRQSVGASRFYYCAKSSTAERSAGLDGRNIHPTCKPVSLMRWLVRLVTPPDGTVLDPFLGSGTTGIACVLEDFDFIGIEREAEYAEIARARIEWWSQFPPGTDVDAALGAEARERAIRDTGQASLLDEAA